MNMQTFTKPFRTMRMTVRLHPAMEPPLPVLSPPFLHLHLHLSLRSLSRARSLSFALALALGAEVLRSFPRLQRLQRLLRLSQLPCFRDGPFFSCHSLPSFVLSSIDILVGGHTSYVVLRGGAMLAARRDRASAVVSPDHSRQDCHQK